MKNKDAKTAKKTVEKKTGSGKPKLKVNKKKIILACVAVLLLVGIGFGTFFVVDYILVDTPYDSVRLPKYVSVAKYIGAELSEAKVQESFDEAKNELIAEFTVKDVVRSGKITEGQNVTVTVKAYDYAAYLSGSRTLIDSISCTGEEIASIKKYDLNDLPEGEEILFPELQNQLIGVDFNFSSEYITNMAPALIYTYPSDYNVSDVQGKQVIHEIYITGVTADSVPEWNDALFANNVDAIDEFLGLSLGFTTVKEYEDYMYEQIRLNLLWNSIVEASTIHDYPEKKIQKYSDEFDEYYNTIMEQNSLEFSELLDELGTDESGYISTRLSYAEGIVKEEMILYEIVQAEKIRISRSEYKEGLEKLAAESGVTADEFEESYGKELAERTVLWEKVKKHLLDNSVSVE